MSILSFKKQNISFGILYLSVVIGTAVWGEVTLKLAILVSVSLVLLQIFLKEFEISVLFLLLLRSSLDLFTQVKIPAVFGVGIELLAIAYIIFCFIKQKKVQTDSFWWLLLGWTIFQSLWLILMPLDALGFDATYLLESIREWLRILLWPTAYFLTMQLKGKISPKRVLSLLLLAIPFPLLIACYQLQAGVVRVNSTFAHANAFASFLLLFMGLVWWKSKNSTYFKWLWILLLGVLSFFLISTKALFILMMLLVSISVIVIPMLSLRSVIISLLCFSLIIGLFSSTDYGKSRLESIGNTPLLNPEISIDRGILLSESDHNSFNWRLSHWNIVLKSWEKYPVLGYGLGLSKQSIDSKYLPHNDYIRALIEGGIFGFFTYLLIWVMYLIRSVHLIHSSTTKSHRDLCLVIFAIYISVLVGMITENIWSHTVFFFYSSVLLAVAGWDWDSPTIIKANK